MSGPVWVAGAREAPVVASLMAEFRDWHGRDRPSDAALRQGVERLIGEPATEYLLGALVDGGEAVGVCQLRFRYGLWHSADDCWLEDLFVREAGRGAGLGRALGEAAIERALRRGCRRIDLDVDSDNEQALALYGRLGFSGATPSGARRLMLRRALTADS